MLADVTGNYPPGAWDADPRAPWNEPDPWEGRTCGECVRCRPLAMLDGSERRVCASPSFDARGDLYEEVDPDDPADACFES